MPETTLLKRYAEMHRAPLPNCHDGSGVLDFTAVLDGLDLLGRRLAFLHDDILDPGVSIGEHHHDHDEEYYYIISGQGTMQLDGVRHAVGPGDVSAVFPGGRHGLENTGDQPLRILVVGLRT